MGLELTKIRMGSYKTTCPKCSHTRKNKKDPCLSVTTTHEGTVFNCHNCGYSGGNMKRGYMKKEYRKPEYAHKVFSNEATVGYFNKRGVGVGTLQKMRISERNGYIVFPYYRNNEVINIKYRGINEKKFIQEKDCEQIYYNIDSVTDGCTVIHTEGEIDCLSFIEAGYEAVISVPSGAPNQEVGEGSAKMEFIQNSAEQLEKATKHILAFDNDKNGNILREEVAKRLGKEKCWIVDFEDCKDANEYLVKHGKVALGMVIAAAKEYPVSGIIAFDSLQAHLIQDLIENGQKNIFSTGWDAIDNFYKVRSQEVTLVTGKPNSGKSLWLDSLLINLAEQYGHKFMIASLEITQTRHFLQLLEKICRRARWIDYDGKNLLQVATPSNYQFLSDHFYLYQTENNDITIDAILTKAREMVLRKGINALVIDPHNQIEHKRPSNMTEHEYIGDVLRRVRKFASETGCHVFYVAHPKKPVAGQTVTAYDISGSANWFNMADNVIVVNRERDSLGYNTTETEISVHKIRNQPEVGKQGKATINFIPKTCRYE